MSANLRKNKRGDQGSSSGSAENSAKKPNMKETEEEGIFGDKDSSEEEPTLLEIKTDAVIYTVLNYEHLKWKT